MFKATVNELKELPCPPSPKKYSNKMVTCNVLTKSPLRPTRNGSSMFSMNLSDTDASTMLRALCFSEDMFSNFEVAGTYDFKTYKVKKGFGSSNRVELLIDHETVFEKSVTKLDIKTCSFTISQILRGEGNHVGFINMKAKVTSIGEVLTVGSFPDQKSKRDVKLADSTGHIDLTLWRERAENVSLFAEEDVLSLENMVLSTFNNHTSVITTFETIISKLDEEMEVSSTPKAAPKSNITSFESSILAIKEFSCAFKCISCRMDVDVKSHADPVLKCPTCSTIFLKRTAQIHNYCKVLLTNQQWFAANNQVIQHLFGWSGPKVEPSNAEILVLLNGVFSIRVDLNRKVIEHAVVVQDEFECPSTSFDGTEDGMEDGMPHKKLKVQ